MCTPPMRDAEIINVLTRHFPPTIQNLLKSVGTDSLERFMSLLGEYDSTFESAQRISRNPTSNINACTYREGSGRMGPARGGRCEIHPRPGVRVDATNERGRGIPISGQEDETRRQPMGRGGLNQVELTEAGNGEVPLNGGSSSERGPAGRTEPV